MVAALEALSGVSVVSAAGDRLEVRLTTRVHSCQPPQAGWPSPALADSVIRGAHASNDCRQPMHADLVAADNDDVPYTWCMTQISLTYAHP